MEVSNIIENGLELRNNYGFECYDAENVIYSKNEDDLNDLIYMGKNLRIAMVSFIENSGIPYEHFQGFFKSDNSLILSCLNLEIEIRISDEPFNADSCFEVFRLNFDGVSVEYFNLNRNNQVRYNIIKGLIGGIFS